MKIRRVGAELFHADRQTDGHDEANSRFSQFCELAQKKTRRPVTGFCAPGRDLFDAKSVSLFINKRNLRQS